MVAPGDQGGWDPSLDEIVSFDNGEAWLTPVFIYGTNAALPLVVAIVFFVQALWLRRKQWLASRAEATAAHPLAEGDAVVTGTANALEGAASPMVKITVTQMGISRSHTTKGGKKSWTTIWTEVSRAWSVAPFRVRTDAGEDVRVEPDERVRLLDELEPAGQSGPERWRVAKLDQGERVYAFGRLAREADPRAGGGYRGGGTSWVLRPRGGPMLLSVGRMSDRFAVAARLRARLAAVLVVFLLVAQAAALGYHVALFRGHAEPAQVVRVDKERGRKRDLYFLTYRRVSTGAELRDQISEGDRHLFTEGRIVPVHVVRFMGEDRVTLGALATANGGVSLVPLLLVIGILVLSALAIRAGRPWYERPKLVETAVGKIE